MNGMQLATTALGLTLGGIFAFIWRLVNRRWGRDDFWQRFLQIAPQLVSGDDDQDFLRLYGALLKSMGMYVGKIFLAIFLASVPIALAWSWWVPLALTRLSRQAEFVELYPSHKVLLEVAGQRLPAPGARGFPIEFPLDSAAVVHLPVGVVRVRTLAVHTACSTSGWQQLLLGFLGFEAAEFQLNDDSEQLFLLVRPTRGDRNVLWPFFSDLEFLLLMAIGVGSIATMLAFRGWTR